MISRKMYSRLIVVLAVVLLAVVAILVTPVCAQGEGNKGQGNAGDATPDPKGMPYRLQAVTTTNDKAGKAQLEKYQEVLKARGYTDMLTKPTQDTKNLCLMVGKIPANRMEAVEAMQKKLAAEEVEGKFPFAGVIAVRSW